MYSRVLVLLHVIGVSLADDACESTTGGALLQSKSTISSESVRAMMPSSKNPELLQLLAKGADVLSSEVTPEVSATIDKLIKIIEDSIELKIKQDHNASQKVIDDKVRAIEELAGSTADFFTTAKNNDEAWMNCIAGEKQLAQDAETQESELQTAADGLTAPCNAQNAGQTWSATVPSSIATLTCDFSQGNCATEYGEYKARLREWADGLQATINVKNADYKRDKQACEEATSVHNAAQNDNNAAVTAWENERVRCEGLNTDRTVSMCVFGEKLQDKCAAKSDYDEHIAGIDAASGPNSEAERENEWASMILLKCMLKKHKDDAEFDEATMASCQGNTYEVEVGTLDKKADAVANLLTQFNCQETSIRFFNGKTCETPDGRHSAGYSCDVAFVPAVDLDMANPAFSFCEARNTEPALE